MAYKVSLAEPAELDAYQAFEYIRNDAPRRAEEWLIGLFREIDTLEEMPRRCPVIAESRELGREIRQLLYGRYRILFDIQEDSTDGPLVRVLRIWHGAQDRVHAEDLDAS